LSGVALKDESTSGGTAQALAGASHFLLPQQP
jgi:hypothetical protein